MSKNEVEIKRKPETEREGEGEEDREWEIGGRRERRRVGGRQKRGKEKYKE